MKKICSSIKEARALPALLLFGCSQLFFLSFFKSVFATDIATWIDRFQAFHTLALKYSYVPQYVSMPPSIPVFKVSGLLFAVIKSLCTGIASTYPEILFKLSLMLPIGVFLVVLFILLQKIIPSKAAFFVCCLTLLNPLYWISNPSDLYVSFFYLLSIISLVLYYKESDAKWMFLSVLFCVLAVTTRHSGLALIPLLFLMLVVGYGQKLVARKIMWRHFILAIILFSLLFILIWPQIISNGSSSLGKNNEVASYLNTTPSGQVPFEQLAFKRLLFTISHYPIPWLLLLSTYVLFGLDQLRKQKNPLRILNIALIAGFLLFISTLIFYNSGLQSSAIRYSLPGIMGLDIVLALEFYRQLNSLWRNKKILMVIYVGLFTTLLIVAYDYYFYI